MNVKLRILGFRIWKDFFGAWKVIFFFHHGLIIIHIKEKMSNKFYWKLYLRNSMAALVKNWCFQFSALKTFHFTPCFVIFFSTENINAENVSAFLHIFQRWKHQRWKCFTFHRVSPYFSALKTYFFTRESLWNSNKMNLFMLF